MSISSHVIPVMTETVLGRYVPEVRDKNEALKTQIAENRSCLNFFIGFGSVCGVSAVGLILIATLSQQGSFFVPFLSGAGVTGIASAVCCGGIVSRKWELNLAESEMERVNTEEADRSEDLQKEANRLLIRKMEMVMIKMQERKWNDCNEKLAQLELIFGIHPTIQYRAFPEG